VAIPLETFVASLRTVLGVLTVGAIRALSFTLRLLGNVFYHVGNTMLHIYDLLIFAPLWVEKQIKGQPSGLQEVKKETEGKHKAVKSQGWVKEAS
jgi:hypothetical protein